LSDTVLFVLYSADTVQYSSPIFFGVAGEKYDLIEDCNRIAYT